MTALQTLIDRLENADGPDRELDRAIMDAVGTVVKEWNPGDGDVQQWREWSNGARVENTHVTFSIDAALALLDAGSEWEMTTLYGIARAGVDLNGENPCYAERKDGNAAMAIVTAALKTHAVKGTTQ